MKMTDAAKQKERFTRKLLAWKARTGNKVFKGIHEDEITRQAAAHMAHKPYARMCDTVTKGE